MIWSFIKKRRTLNFHQLLPDRLSAHAFYPSPFDPLLWLTLLRGCYHNWSRRGASLTLCSYSVKFHCEGNCCCCCCLKPSRRQKAMGNRANSGSHIFPVVASAPVVGAAAVLATDAADLQQKRPLTAAVAVIEAECGRVKKCEFKPDDVWLWEGLLAE